MLKKITNISNIVTWDNKNDSLKIISNNDILLNNDKIVKISPDIKNFDILIDANNNLITPGFIDSHTHPVFVKNRSNEFIMRLNNKSYTEIFNNGGGIHSSIGNLRNASFDELYESALNNIKPFISNGTTSLEAKTGYGLTFKDEIRSLEVIKKINNDLEIDLYPTFLGAHAVPPEFLHKKEEYIKLICNEMIPEISKNKLAIFCDVFCEEGYFNIQESEQILEVAKAYNLIPKIHADEFKYSGGVELAKKVGAISADHLMAINNDGIKALSSSKVIGTLLPGTSFFLNKKYANGRKLIDNGCQICLATDFNPGTCTIKSLPIIMFLSMYFCGMKLDESFKAITYNAAKAIGQDSSLGLIKEGYNADMIFWDINSIDEIPYWFDSAPNKIKKIIKSGKTINL